MDYLYCNVHFLSLQIYKTKYLTQVQQPARIFWASFFFQCAFIPTVDIRLQTYSLKLISFQEKTFAKGQFLKKYNYQNQINFIYVEGHICFRLERLHSYLHRNEQFFWRNNVLYQSHFHYHIFWEDKYSRRQVLAKLVLLSNLFIQQTSKNIGQDYLPPPLVPQVFFFRQKTQSDYLLSIYVYLSSYLHR